MHSKLLYLFPLLLLVQLVAGHGYIALPSARNYLGQSTQPRQCPSSQLPCRSTVAINYDGPGLNNGGAASEYAHCPNSGGWTTGCPAELSFCGNLNGKVTDHEDGPNSPYSTGYITAQYLAGGHMYVSLAITANHFGYFEFHLAAVPNTKRYDVAGPDACTYPRYKLAIANYDSTQYRCSFHQFDPQYQWCLDGSQAQGAATYGPSSAANIELILPAGVTCDRCLLQWTYITGNSPQSNLVEIFQNCADIGITSDASKVFNNQKPSNWIASPSSPTSGAAVAHLAIQDNPTITPGSSGVCSPSTASPTTTPSPTPPAPTPSTTPTPTATPTPTPGNLLKDPSFENPSGVWTAYGSGYTSVSSAHDGSKSISCSTTSTTATYGAYQVVNFGNSVNTVVVSGWSMSTTAVSGSNDNNYAIFVDMLYTDNTWLYGSYAAFTTGAAHTWEFKSVTINAQKKIASIYVYALFRSHSGTVYFDQFSVTGTSPSTATPTPTPPAPTPSTAPGSATTFCNGKAQGDYCYGSSTFVSCPNPLGTVRNCPAGGLICKQQDATTVYCDWPPSKR